MLFPFLLLLLQPLLLLAFEAIIHHLSIRGALESKREKGKKEGEKRPLLLWGNHFQLRETEEVRRKIIGLLISLVIDAQIYKLIIGYQAIHLVVNLEGSATKTFSFSFRRSPPRCWQKTRRSAVSGAFVWCWCWYLVGR